MKGARARVHINLGPVLQGWKAGVERRKKEEEGREEMEGVSVCVGGGVARGKREVGEDHILI